MDQIMSQHARCHYIHNPKKMKQKRKKKKKFPINSRGSSNKNSRFIHNKTTHAWSSFLIYYHFQPFQLGLLSVNLFLKQGVSRRHQLH